MSKEYKMNSLRKYFKLYFTQFQLYFTKLNK